MTETTEHKALIDQMPTKLVHISSIKLGERLRRDHGAKEIQDLKDSLYNNGQFHPIVIEGEELQAGARRMIAAGMLLSEGKTIGGAFPEGDHRRLPKGYVRATDFLTLTPVQRLLVEIGENRDRKNFTEVEEALAIRKLKQLMADEAPAGTLVTNRTVAKTLGKGKASVTMSLRVAKAIEQDGRKELLKMSSARAAYTRLNTLESLEKIQKRLEGMKPEVKAIEERLVQGDGVKWLKSLPDQSIDFVNFDPPWGIGIDAYDRRHKYEEFDDDMVRSWEHIIIPSIPEIYRILKDDTWSIIWFGEQFQEKLATLCEEAGFIVRPSPSIWYKPNKGGATNDPDRDELNVYEAFMVLRKGDPRLFKPAQRNVLPYDMDRDRIHFAQKPRPLMKDILERYTFGHMRVIDPTFGSGTFLIEAKQLGREYEGREMNAENVKAARLLMQMVSLADVGKAIDGGKK